MKQIPALLLSSVLLLEGLTGCGSQQETAVKNFTAPEQGEELVVIHVKDYGTIKIKVFSDLLPKACENFVTHAKDGYYDGLPFHRVIENFMIQGGDPKGDGTGGESIWGGKFDGGVDDSLIHVRGAVAYANSGGTDTDGSQFFFVTGGAVSMDTLKQYEEHGDGSYTKEQKELYTTIGGAPWLDGKYTVFGQVVDGLDVAITISEQETDSNNKPYTSIIMDSVTVEPYDGSELHWYASSATEPSETSDDAA